MNRLPIVTPAEMKRLENAALHIEREWIEWAGQAVAKTAMRLFSPTSVTLLIGKGNNGADGLAAGIALLEAGIPVTALFLFEKRPALWQERFFKAGGKEVRDIGSPSLFIDAIFGVGFEGKVGAGVAAVIDKVNQSKIPILALDIPSGLNGTDGSVEGSAIRATATVAIELPKWGFFVKQGWEQIGRLEVAQLTPALAKMAKPQGWIIDETTVAMPPIQRIRHKYEAGYVVGRGGMGAIFLAGMAALKTGAGLVRLFTETERVAPLELIAEPFLPKRWKEEGKRASSYLIGPGMALHAKEKEWVKKYLPHLDRPAVIDAGALSLLPLIKEWPHAIYTPHRGEIEAMSRRKGDPHEIARELADERGITLLLKGSPTFLYTKGEKPWVIHRGDPGMATAGSGDVLSGILASLLSQKMGLLEAALVGAFLHAIAGEIAADEETSYSVTASSLLRTLPKAIHRLRQ